MVVVRRETGGPAEHPKQFARLRGAFDAEFHHHADAFGQRQHDQSHGDAGEGGVANGVFHPAFNVADVDLTEPMEPLARTVVERKSKKEMSAESACIVKVNKKPRLIGRQDVRAK